MPLRAPQVYPDNQRSFDQWTRNVAVTPDDDSVTTITVADKAITDPKLRDSQPTSVIGRTTNSPGPPADIAAGADNLFLVRRTGSLEFSTIGDSDIPASIARDTEVSAGDAVVTTAFQAADVTVAANAASALAAALASGTYTPTLIQVTNLSATTAYLCTYCRVNTVVTVSGRVDITPTAPGLVELGITLPIASNFADNFSCCGTAFSNLIAGQGAAILSDLTNDRASLQYNAVDTTSKAMLFIFQYRII